MAFVLMALGGLTGLVSLICWIIVLIKMFSDEVNGGVGKGIFGVICGLYALIWGWQNADKHDIRPVMLAWTIAFVLGIVINGASQAMMASSY